MRRLVAVAASLLFLLAACGDSTGPGGGNTLVNGTFSATVNGNQFVPLSATASTTTSGSNTIVSVGAGNQTSTFAFAVFVTGPDTYTISQTNGNNALYIESGAAYHAAFGVAGTNGTITLSAVGATRIAGTFTFTMVPPSGSTGTGTRVVTGSFDIDPSYGG